MRGSSRNAPAGELPEIQDLPAHIDRRTFLMHHAVIDAAAAVTGTSWDDRDARAASCEGAA